MFPAVAVEVPPVEAAVVTATQLSTHHVPPMTATATTADSPATSAATAPRRAAAHPPVAAVEDEEATDRRHPALATSATRKATSPATALSSKRVIAG